MVNKRPSPRMEILSILKVHGSLSASDLASKFGTGVSAVRPHLERLAADELVAIEVIRGGRGRPRYLYSLTESAEHEFPNDYESLALDLFDGAAQIGGDEMLGRIFDFREESLYSALKPRVDASTVEGKLEQINGALNQLGYMSSVEREADGFALYARHCPVPAISDHSSLPCQCEKNVIERLLDVDIIAEETGYDSSRPCKFKVAVAT
jgi:predicted ArsR family transcriptional regulator